jgi:4-amino-4-deoxy-L-arabinose transferase-like glycosyltransferase
VRRAATAGLVALAAAGAGTFVAAGREADALTGLRLLRLPEERLRGDVPVAEFRAGGLELPRHGQEHLPWRRVRARYVGYLLLGAAGQRELRLVANADAALRIDGRELLARGAEAEAPSVRLRTELSAGAHTIEVDYASEEGPHLLRVLLAEPGEPPARLPREQLFPLPPTPELLTRLGRARALRRLGLVLLLIAGAALAASLAPRSPPRSRLVVPLLALLLVVFAALLRLEAVVNLQWQERAPPRLRALAVAMGELHPAGLRLKPGEPGYEGDPFAYLRFAREMRGFYDAHVREPVFVASARALLALLGGDDAGLALTSALYSTLLVAATFLLGASFFSPSVGLLAALPLALERHSVAFSALGWRDDAFAFFTALTLVALRRLVDRPGVANALLAGLVAALACLTRITSLAFVLPAFAAVFVMCRRAHARRADPALLAGALVFTAALLPYLVTCWIAFGDAFHSINAHTVFYRGRAGLAHDQPMNALRFLSHRRGALELADTGLVGLTTYPFLNKWADFDDWVPGASLLFAGASLVGLLGFCFEPRARLLLLALFAALVPYAFTWQVPGGNEWRFTLHAYPFYLVAAAWALLAAFRGGWRAPLLRGLALGVVALPLAWLGASGLHYLRVREDLRAGKPALVAAGPRDAWLFARGWGGLRRFGNGFSRRAGPSPTIVRLPLDPARAYRATLRLRPLETCAAPCSVSVALDGRPLGELAATHDDTGRFASTTLELPADGSRRGASRLELRGGPVELWLLTLEPRTP